MVATDDSHQLPRSMPIGTNDLLHLLGEYATQSGWVDNLQLFLIGLKRNELVRIGSCFLYIFIWDVGVLRDGVVGSRFLKLHKLFG